MNAASGVEELAMSSFFSDLGNEVLKHWKKENFCLGKFPAIAQTLLEKRPPSANVDLSAFLRDFLLNDAQPHQTDSNFGQPEIVVYDHPRFYIQMLFWLDGTTAIHQHEFSGAFHVMAGSSIHAQFEFHNAQPITPYFHIGDLKMTGVSLLEKGCTVPIVSGSSCIHSLFHLDSPSVTVVVRTQNDPGTSPQFNYLPPHIAYDPVFSDTLMIRRKQVLDVLETTGDASYAELVLKMIRELDFERGFHTLQNSMIALQQLGVWQNVFSAFQKKHGQLASGVEATLQECVRRDTIKSLRGSITDPGHRFFLALLLNVPKKADLLSLIAQRFPDEPPLETILRWAEELLEETYYGVAILDAVFPEALEIDLEEQPAILIAALRRFIDPSAMLPKGISRKILAPILDTFRKSSLRVLSA